MPPPKDPEKADAYSKKMSEIAKEKGYGKWMIGKHPSKETREKISRTHKELDNVPEERERRSQRAKRIGVGKWMLGKKCPGVSKANTERTKGKTYIEMYGVEKAEEIAHKVKVSNRITWIERRKGIEHPELNFPCHRGETYTEIYGDRADEERRKRSVAHLERWDRIGRKDEIESRQEMMRMVYRDWRTNVFKRDNYLCQICSQNGCLEVHHIKSWVEYPELRYIMENGITLCKKHHRLVHKFIRLRKKEKEIDKSSFCLLSKSNLTDEEWNKIIEVADKNGNK